MVVIHVLFMGWKIWLQAVIMSSWEEPVLFPLLSSSLIFLTRRFWNEVGELRADFTPWQLNILQNREEETVLGKGIVQKGKGLKKRHDWGSSNLQERRREWRASRRRVGMRRAACHRCRHRAPRDMSRC